MSHRFALAFASCLLLACGGSTPPAEEPVASTPAAAPAPLSDVPPQTMPAEAGEEPGLVQNPGSRWAIVTGFDWAFRMPAGWHRLTDEELSQNREQMLTGESREIVAAHNDRWARTVQIAMSESPLDEVAGVVPTLIVTLREQDQPHPVAAICEAVRQGLAQGMENVELMSSDPRQVAGRSGGVCVIRYTLSTRHGPQRVEAHSYFAMQDTLLLQVALSGPAPQDPTELNALVASVRAVSRDGAAPIEPADDAAQPEAAQPEAAQPEATGPAAAP